MCRASTHSLSASHMLLPGVFGRACRYLPPHLFLNTEHYSQNPKNRSPLAKLLSIPSPDELLVWYMLREATNVDPKWSTDQTNSEVDFH
ncbi:hypothetical protein QQF64_022505 [Cirrhinus molitorella]|uniref:NAC domain-containing protein n=1 Tax=Cirrhinus molitorella TaxID=172907 RepID=A0ABR3L2L5_9TELE